MDTQNIDRIMKILKAVILIILALVSASMYGVYAYVSVHDIRTVATHSWVLTGMFGIGFLIFGIKKWSEIIKI
ncbi:hypothetical protein LCGC14_0503720 [marine sediment metagenome]|uniref:Uncharacterized protein n=1 Tax=marine sediment metagenome TaxID=412755 RepID=A0A0F9S887_9ZZZZ